ncbi:hypothetical protein OG601_46945 [Streptomyces sp. NBC_01239]|uniref:hypothetical protein n=1 Tax=Streptomyces sp. NBC_01239 TaxID=2903792 RepID=UPI0022579BCB|nr:hypothetical protein [Streptomyces sp. NBC_01239]MCX4809071.1 hypothetical protein [Streptomyces sp. NBC_01239]MCX4818112.1 hypothetical protein [Streptomyces sp. NBC_01239]
MTLTSDARPTTFPAAVSEVPADLADRVVAHMQGKFPDDVDAGAWTVARDSRDNTAVVVWRAASDLLTLPQIRGLRLGRWLDSLRDAGFTADARTDMEVFGRPDEQSPDGRARWLHITGWTKPQPRVDRVAGRTAKVCHHVVLDPATTPLMDNHWRKNIRPDMVAFTYHPDGICGGLTAVVYVAGEEAGDPLGVHIPDWLRDIAEAHRGHATKWSWCRPAGDPLTRPEQPVVDTKEAA